MSKTKVRVVLALLALLGIAGISVAYVLLRPSPHETVRGGREVVAGEYVGQTKDAILARFGPPSTQWDGHYGNPSWDSTKDLGSVVSMTYDAKNGTLYLSFAQKNGAWVCWSSHWMPEGAVF